MVRDFSRCMLTGTMHRPVVWWASVCALGVGLAVHFALLIASAAPPLVPSGVRALAAGYTEPFFRQSWAFFAPEPAPFHHAVAVRGIPDVGESTPWLPLTDLAIQTVQANRVSGQGASLTAILHAAYSLADLRLLHLDEAIRQRLVQDQGNPSRKSAALIVLERVGAVALAEAYPSLDLARVQIRLSLRGLGPERGAGEPGPSQVIELVYPPAERPLVTPRSPAR